MTRPGIPALTAVLALAAGCAGNGLDDAVDGFPADGEMVASQRVLSEQYSGFEQPQRRVIRSESEWAAFWNQAFAGRSQVPARPDVDFDREMVIAAALGQRPTGGYSIEIQRVRRTPAGLMVEVVETAPAPDCIVSQTITSPVYAVRVPATGEPVQFIESDRVRSCE